MLQRLAPTAVMLVLSTLAVAEPATKADKTDKKPPPAATAENIARWIKDMDSDEYAVREEAVARLTAAGTLAVTPVAKAAKGDSLEVTTRAVKVLQNMLSGKDADAKAAAKAALEELAKDQKHPSSHMAWKALQEKNPARTVPGRMPGQIVIGGNVIQLVAGAGRMQIAVKNVNGNKEVDVTENDRKIRITEDKDGITVTVTDPPKGDAKPKPKQYKAADEKELKKKHPEAHTLYEKYAKGQNAAAIRIVGGNIGGVVNPIKNWRAQLPKRLGRQASNSGKLLDEAAKELDRATARLKAALDAQKKRVVRDEDKLDLAELLKQIEAARKKVADARKGLRR